MYPSDAGVAFADRAAAEDATFIEQYDGWRRCAMPVHDWTRVRAGTFHFFHQSWITYLCEALNGGSLPPGYFAMSEQEAKGPIPDVLALKAPTARPVGSTGRTVLEVQPRA